MNYLGAQEFFDMMRVRTLNRAEARAPGRGIYAASKQNYPNRSRKIYARQYSLAHETHRLAANWQLMSPCQPFPQANWRAGLLVRLKMC